MDEMKRLLKQEREEHDEKIDSVFDEYNINFTGKGPEASDLRASQKQQVEDAEEEDPFNTLGYGWTAYF